ncbi:MAG: hypothetical protein WAM11_05105 [Cyanobium sp.]
MGASHFAGSASAGEQTAGASAPAALDFDALDNLRRLALAEQVPAPKQLELV